MLLDCTSDDAEIRLEEATAEKKETRVIRQFFYKGV